MDSYDAERIARLEYQVGRLYQHLGLDPNPTDAPPAPFGGAPVPAFGAPAPAYGQPAPAYGAPAPAYAQSDPAADPAYGAGPVFPPSFADALRTGKLIQAIKIYREVTGVGLKEAKEAVEALARNGGVR
jgi:Ribosomal protein L7/L12 C-terminal domain